MYPQILPTLVEGLLPPLALLGVLLFLLCVFALRQRLGGSGAFRAPDRGESFLLSRFLRNYWYWLLRPIEETLVRARFRPEWVNYLGLGTSVVSGFFYAFGFLQLGGWALLLAGCMDMIDGQVARKSGRASRRGAFMDSTFDRYSEISVFLGLMVCFRENLVVWLLSAFALSGSFMVSYCRARGEGLGVAVHEVGFMQRAERLVLLIAASLVTPLSLVAQQAMGIRPGLWAMAMVLGLLALGTNWTAWTRFRYVWNALEEASPAPPPCSKD